MKAKTVPLVLLLALAMLSTSFVAASGQAPVPAGQTGIVRVYFPDRSTGQQLFVAFEAQILDTDWEAGYHVMQAGAEEVARLEAYGLRVEPDTAYVAPPVVPSLPAGIQSIPGYSCYRTVEETYAAAQALVTAHPDLASWVDVGDSWKKSVGQGGYDMRVLKLTNSAVPGPKPDLFVTGSIHAREYTPAETATRFGEYLVNNYGIDPDVTWILDHHEIHLALQANPDGRKQAETGLSWRKNVDNDDGCNNSSAWGTDLNRNFSFKWGCCGGSSGQPCNDLYRGPSAGSEPETQAVQNYMAAIFPDQRGPGDTDPAPADATGIYIDLHSYSELVMWPWGWTNTNSPNSTQLQTLGRKFAYFNSYTPQKAYSLYATDGTTDDHAYGLFGVASYCFEMGTTFFQGCTTFENTIYPANLQALIYAAKVVRTPYMTPLGPDAISLALSDDEVPQGTPVTLTGTAVDTRYNNSNGTEPTQNIAAAEYYLDIPPWGTGAVAHAMAASDGSFNSKSEGVTATVDTSGLAAGRHIVFVRGQDAGANWGAFSAVFLTITGGGPVTVFFDDFETNLGWIRNPSGGDTATLGVWERADPAATSYNGAKQLGTAYSGSYDLVTGPLAGANAGSYDLDGGTTTIRSPGIALPAGKTLTLTFKYYLAHAGNSSSADVLRVRVIGAAPATVFQEVGAANNDNAAWATFSANLTSFGGQTVYLLIIAADASAESLVEAAIDDVLITAQ